MVWFDGGWGGASMPVLHHGVQQHELGPEEQQWAEGPAERAGASGDQERASAVVRALAVAVAAFCGV